jgi:hypothetical protein
MKIEFYRVGKACFANLHAVEAMITSGDYCYNRTIAIVAIESDAINICSLLNADLKKKSPQTKGR